MAWYWAYGEDMDESRLKEACPGAKKITIAKLPAAKPEFFDYDQGSPTVDIVTDKGDMWGVLYFIPDIELMNVARLGGAGRTVRYRPVWDGGNCAYNAYLLEGDAETEPVPAPKELAERLFGLAVAHELPEKYTGILGAAAGKK